MLNILYIADEDGVNYALPLSVYGTGYTQMHAINSNKVEKLVSNLSNFILSFKSDKCLSNFIVDLGQIFMLF